MDEYKKLLSLLNYSLQAEDVMTTDEKISIFDLYIILNERLSNLRNLSYKLREKFIQDNTVIVKKGFFPRRTIIVTTQKCDIWFTGNKNISVIRFFYGDNIYTDSFNHYSMVVLSKKRNSNIFKFDEKDKEFVKIYFNEFLEMFATMEEYIELFSESNEMNNDEIITDISSKEYIEAFEDEFFQITVTYTNAGEVDVNVSIKEEIDKDRISLMESVEVKSIQTIINENKELLLKKISINIKDLDKLSKKIFDEQMVKGKTLKK